MDDENLSWESYFTIFAAVISALDPKAADFEFEFNNLHNAVQISGLLTDDEKQQLNSMLHVVSVRSKLGGSA